MMLINKKPPKGTLVHIHVLGIHQTNPFDMYNFYKQDIDPHKIQQFLVDKGVKFIPACDMWEAFEHILIMNIVDMKENIRQGAPYVTCLECRLLMELM